MSVGVRFSRPWLRRGEARRRSRHLQAAWRARYVTAKAACLRQFSKPVFLHENHIVVPLVCLAGLSTQLSFILHGLIRILFNGFISCLLLRDLVHI